MQLLTGGSSSFIFVPTSITSIGSTVLAEGCDPKNPSASWVHAWTVSNDGLITQIREYFNTSLTVKSFRKCSSSTSKPSVRWESKLSGKSVPGLVLAI
ncbi:hypothetical protein ACHQM5_020472 [Ranunculus cassubicifolius]